MQDYEGIIDNEVVQFGTIPMEKIEDVTQAFHTKVENEGVDENYIFKALRGEIEDTTLLEEYFSQGLIDENLFYRIKEHNQVILEIYKRLGKNQK